MHIIKKYFLLMFLLIISVILVQGCAGREVEKAGKGEQKKAAKVEAKVWKCSTLYTENHPYYSVAKHFANEVEKRTNGNLKIQIYPGSSLVSPSQEFNSVKNRAIDCTLAVPSYSEGIHPITGFAGFLSWYTYDKWDKMHADVTKICNDKFFKKEGILFGPPNIMCNYALVSRKPIKAFNDQKGLTTRSFGGMMGEVQKKWECKPTQVSAPETYIALQRGILDTAWLDYSRIVADKIWEVAPYCIGSDELVAPVITLFINLKSFEELPKEYQDVIYAVLEENFKVGLAVSKESTQKSMDEVKKRMKQFTVLQPGELLEMRKLSEPVWEMYINKAGDPAKEISAIVKKAN